LAWFQLGQFLKRKEVILVCYEYLLLIFVKGNIGSTEGVPGPSNYQVGNKVFHVTKTEAPKYRLFFISMKYNFEVC